MKVIVGTASHNFCIIISNNNITFINPPFLFLYKHINSIEYSCCTTNVFSLKKFDSKKSYSHMTIKLPFDY